jgi:hypothetical protein
MGTEYRMEFLYHPSKVLPDGRTRILLEIFVAPESEPGESLAQEAALQAAMNKLACQVMEVHLKSFDTHGESILVNNELYTSKGLSSETYQCYGGPCRVERYTYQSSNGGRTYCPLEQHARIIENTTPHFASIVTGKYSAQSAGEVIKDLTRTMQRNVTRSYIQDLCESVGRAVQAKEIFLAYKIKTPPSKVHAILVAADAANVNLVNEGYKNVCAGCFCLMDEHGECLETICIANAPEEGKTSFWKRMELETARLKELMPDVAWFGISDGACDIQAWLERHCDVVTLDFFHLSEYLNEAKAAFGASQQKQQSWVEKVLHELKHEPGAAPRILEQLERKSKSNCKSLSEEMLSAVVKAVGYMERNIQRMEYADVREANMPIGSGVIEATCKNLIKQRACGSGMKWKRKGLQNVLSLRSLYQSSDRWEQFWQRCAAFGY